MDKVHEGISELEFSPQDIPDHAVKIAALAAVGLTESILRRPGGREMLDRETERRRLRQRERGERVHQNEPHHAPQKAVLRPMHLK